MEAAYVTSVPAPAPVQSPIGVAPAASPVSSGRRSRKAGHAALRASRTEAISGTPASRFFKTRAFAEEVGATNSGASSLRMSTSVSFTESSRAALSRGVKAVADAVSITMGPKGRNVVLSSKNGVPRIVNDGVTIAREISLEDPEENAGVRLIQTVAMKTNDVAGDGTTTATVLARELVIQGLKNVAAGANPVYLKRGIDKATAFLKEEIRKAAVEVDEKSYEKVATISCGDEALGKLIGDAMCKIGRGGIIQVESSKTTETVVEIEEGMQFDRGYISSQFVTNLGKSVAELEDVYLLITDLRIDNISDILPILEKVTKTGKPLLIIADDVTGDALSTLVLNKAAGVAAVCAVKAPSFGLQRRGRLEDIAILTRGSFLGADLGVDLKAVELEQLGRVRKVVVHKDKTVILAGDEPSEDVQLRVKFLRSSLTQTDSKWEKEKLTERINNLTGGIACIKVGAATETEMESNKLRVEDAVNALQAAVEEGIVPGGGACLIKLIPKLEEFGRSLEHPDEQTGADIVARAIASPQRQIATNAGAPGDVIVEKVKELPFSHGFNALNGEFCDLLAAGVIDPAKVTRLALENAASVGGLILTTEALVAQIPEAMRDETGDEYSGMPGMDF